MLSRIACKIVEKRQSPRKHADLQILHAFAVVMHWFPRLQTLCESMALQRIRESRSGERGCVSAPRGCAKHLQSNSRGADATPLAVDVRILLRDRMMSMNPRPRLLITMGDVAGIGPE